MTKQFVGFKIEENILKGNKVAYPNEYSSVGSFVLEALKSNLDLVGQVEAATGKSQTQRTVIDRSIRCALWMQSQGVDSGDVVAVCSHNQLDVPLACFATLYLGAVVSPWDDRMNAKDFRHLLNLTKPKMAFVCEEAVASLAEAAKEVKPDLKIIVFGRVPGFLEFDSVITEPRASDVKDFSGTSIRSPDESAFIMLSSGTTGLPKGVTLSHDSLLGQFHLVKKVTRGNQCVAFSPICWISGVLFMFVNLGVNNTRIIPPEFDEYSACALIEKYKIETVFLASGMINRILKSGATKKHDITSLAHIIYGGAPLPASSLESFSKLLPNVFISAAYGMTEVGGLFSTQSVNYKPGSCGKIVENTELRVVELNTGKTLGANQAGELLLKTPTMMKFYYNNPKATTEAIDNEGWVRSGDLGYYDEEGEIFIIERLKELIKYRGYQISPTEIESVLSSHPGVKEVAVVPSPHPLDDEHPVAIVVKKSDSNGVDPEVTEKELVDLVAAQLSDYKQLRGGVRFIDEMPKTASGKIQRRELRDFVKTDKLSNLTRLKQQIIVIERK